MSRIIKQIIYGAFYLIAGAGIIYGLYYLLVLSAPTCFDNRQNQGEEGVDCGGPCVPCALKNLQLLRSNVQTVAIDGNTNAVITLANPNLTYGASFTYTLNFYNSAKEKIFSITKESFIYPAEAQKTLIEPNLRINSAAISGLPELVLANFSWKPITQFNEPMTQVRQVKTEISGKLVSVTGLLANRESFSLSRAGIGLQIYQKLSGGNKLVGVSKTILQDLKPFEERAFKLIAPLDFALKLSDIDTVITKEVQR